jgi:hypothetical protein
VRVHVSSPYASQPNLPKPALAINAIETDAVFDR